MSFGSLQKFNKIGYTAFDHILMDKILPRFKPATQIVFVRLWRLTFGFGEEFKSVTQGTLAKRCNMTSKTLRQHLDILEAANLIKVTRVQGDKSIYFVNPFWLESEYKGLELHDDAEDGKNLPTTSVKTTEVPRKNLPTTSVKTTDNKRNSLKENKLKEKSEKKSLTPDKIYDCFCKERNPQARGVFPPPKIRDVIIDYMGRKPYDTLEAWTRLFSDLKEISDDWLTQERLTDPTYVFSPQGAYKIIIAVNKIRDDRRQRERHIAAMNELDKKLQAQAIHDGKHQDIAGVDQEKISKAFSMENIFKKIG